MFSGFRVYENLWPRNFDSSGDSNHGTHFVNFRTVLAERLDESRVQDSFPFRGREARWDGRVGFLRGEIEPLHHPRHSSAHLFAELFDGAVTSENLLLQPFGAFREGLLVSIDERARERDREEQWVVTKRVTVFLEYLSSVSYTLLKRRTTSIWLSRRKWGSQTMGLTSVNQQTVTDCTEP